MPHLGREVTSKSSGLGIIGAPPQCSCLPVPATSASMRHLRGSRRAHRSQEGRGGTAGLSRMDSRRLRNRPRATLSDGRPRARCRRMSAFRRMGCRRARARPRAGIPFRQAVAAGRKCAVHRRSIRAFVAPLPQAQAFRPARKAAGHRPRNRSARVRCPCPATGSSPLRTRLLSRAISRMNQPLREKTARRFFGEFYS